MQTIKYLIIDTETTGLDASKHEMLAFGAVVVVDGRIVETLELKIKPARIENADKKALEVNGYTERAWRDAVTKRDAAEILKYFLITHRDATSVGHNLQFDIKFIKAFSAEQNVELRVPWPYIDTRDLCRAVLAPFGLQSMSLDSICEFLGWRRKNAHTALSDCEDCAKLIINLCPPSPRFLLRLKAMQLIRNMGSLL